MSSKIHPLYNTTYTLHRLSPLHAFPALASTAALTQHAKSLLSILRGDVLRGVRVRDDNDDDDALGRAGRLKNVTWEPLRSPRRWRQPPDDNDDNDDDDEPPLGVLIELAYDHATYTALLLLAPSPAPAPAPGPAGAFTALPLLLTRLPKSLRSALLDYLAASFDTQAQALALDSRVLKRLLEAWLGAVFVAGDGDGDGDAGRDVQIVFSAPAGVVTLKAVTVTVPRGDVAGFWRRGRRMLAAGEGGGEAGEGGEGAFFEALRRYALGTMGLDIAALGVMKVACGGFVLGAGAGAAAAGKVKVFAPRSGGGGERAAEGLVGGLVEASLVAVLK